ncbi:BrnT family toxin [Pseudoduganella danionis]|uniref:BrnT family toxin n=1 Tax=Pseudoduganella danionis TaxID=1890295 RepID=A0ABW9SLH5_9BURK|nr:BrnT family toxin [Pseudoduganella danionis]
MRFLSDPNKARLNLLKHRVSFDEAATVFDDEYAYGWPDSEHPEAEQRMCILGISAHGRILLVCYCCRSFNNIRIYSARKANAREKREYLRRR